MSKRFLAGWQSRYPESDPELEKWVQYRPKEILQGKAGHMAPGMRRSATRQKLSSKKRTPVDKCATYLLNKSPYLRACLIIRESKRNLMKMRTNFHKFCVNSRTIDIKSGGIGAIFMGLQPIHQLSNRLLGLIVTLQMSCLSLPER